MFRGSHGSQGAEGRGLGDGMKNLTEHDLEGMVQTGGGDNYNCPKCSWEHPDIEGPPFPRSMLGFTQSRSTHSVDYGAGEDWEEAWRCPKCKTKFFYTNGYP